MVRDVSTVPLRTSSERLSSPAPERLDILRNYSTLWVASLDGTNPDDNNAWIRLDFPWCRQRINVLGTGKIFDILSSLLQAFFTPAGQGKETIKKIYLLRMRAPTSGPSGLSALGSHEQRTLLATVWRSHSDSGNSCRPFCRIHRIPQGWIFY